MCMYVFYLEAKSETKVYRQMLSKLPKKANYKYTIVFSSTCVLQLYTFSRRHINTSLNYRYQMLAWTPIRGIAMGT